jgi:rare lipoprotein A
MLRNPGRKKHKRENAMRLRMNTSRWRCAAPVLLALLLAACSTTPLTNPETGRQAPQASVPKKSGNPALPPAGSGKGGYYKDDGPADQIPEGLLDTPDPEPRIEPYSRAASRPYNVFGVTYTPITDQRPFKQRGIGSWYGKKFHGQKTSSGEIYDMFKMTAAHPTLPIPSYARVTNLDNNKQVIVRINDRGPFHSTRVIDLSYTAALKLGYLGKGSGMLEVERLLPEEIERMASAKSNPPADTGAVVPAAYVKPLNTGTPAASNMQAASVPNTSAPSIIAPGFYLQLGAYGQAANAEVARAKMLESWPTAMPAIDIVEIGTLHRLQSGPFATRMEADAAALQLRNAGTAKPMVVQK